MNLLAKRDPLRELDDFSNRLSSFFHRSSHQKRNGDLGLTQAQWAPLVDITEDAQEYLLKAELPGLKKDEVKVTVEGGILAISGERKSEHEEKSRKFHRIERTFGSFIRSFSLLDNTDGSKVRAEFKNGLLLVHLPKNKNASANPIEIEVN